VEIAHRHKKTKGTAKITIETAEAVLTFETAAVTGMIGVRSIAKKSSRCRPVALTVNSANPTMLTGM
jgi:hypothetical protein